MKLLDRIKKLSIQWKTIFVVICLQIILLFGVSFILSHYSIHYYTELQQKYSTQVIKEISSQIEKKYSQADELYLTFQMQKPFSEQTLLGDTTFERVHKQMEFESSVRNMIHVNNLQNLIHGILFYLDDTCYAYVGSGALDKQFSFPDAPWYLQFKQQNGKKLIYGPLVEDFKSASTERETCIYYIARYGSGSQFPFLLIELDLDELLKPVASFQGDDQRVIITNQSNEIIYETGFRTEEETIALEKQLSEKHFSKNEIVSGFLGSYYTSSCYLNALGWNIMILNSSDSVLHDYNQMHFRIIFLTGILELIGVLLAVFLIHRIVMPLNALNYFIDIMQDDPDAFVEVNPSTEIGKIGTRLNEMKKRIIRMNKEIYLAQLQEKEAQVNAMQAQINPHFLYNTLDNIYCVAQLGETEPLLSLIEKLSGMMRYSMDMKQKRVPLKQELEHIHNYIAIMNIRFDDRILLINQIPEVFHSVQVLKLSLQPLVENAWQHGLLLQERDFGTIILSAKAEQDVLFLYIENDGISIPFDRLTLLNHALSTLYFDPIADTTRNGIGLQNINNRLKLTFGPSYGLHLVSREGGGCRVIMTVPLLS